MVILKWSKGEIEVKIDFMDTILRVNKIEFFDIIRDGSHYQITIGWEVNYGCSVLAVKLITSVTAVLTLMPP